MKGKLYKDFCVLSRDILRLANKGEPIASFLSKLSEMLFIFSGVDEIEMLMNGDKTNYYWMKRKSDDNIIFKRINGKTGFNIEELIKSAPLDNGLNEICLRVCNDDKTPEMRGFTRNGSFWTGDSIKPVRFSRDTKNEIWIESAYKTIAIIKFIVNENNTGLLLLKSEPEYFFTEKEVEFYEGVIQTLGVAIADRRAQEALRERVKELTCLYNITRILENSEIDLGEALQKVVEELPVALQYPSSACARIILKKEVFSSTNFKESSKFISASLKEGGKITGKVEVFYYEEESSEELFFLTEEYNLIEAVAKQVSVIIERRQRAEEKEKLQFQLRHADRLATIGQLAAGVAHELNEPLGNILGYAQLVKKDKDLSSQAQQDVEVIVKASLLAREIIKKLMFFAKQMPPKEVTTNLNDVIKESLYFLESRCTNAGIEIKLEPEENLPEIIADPLQLHQVMVNLIVNAIQAMPSGGTLIIRSKGNNEEVILEVEDTGIGMSEETAEKIFLPFFSTKDVTEGTGLGLPVVHGIIEAHGGKIEFKTTKGKGTVFKIILPRVLNKEKNNDE
ncbi:MAG: ATP-binding protein [bacterium]|nr:ATP-binding protein [bacterium]